ncbi:MAG: hypothetical protein ACFB3T_01745 [Geminicoccaceae bacterium]
MRPARTRAPRILLSLGLLMLVAIGTSNGRACAQPIASDRVRIAIATEVLLEEPSSASLRAQAAAYLAIYLDGAAREDIASWAEVFGVALASRTVSDERADRALAAFAAGLIDAAAHVHGRAGARICAVFLALSAKRSGASPAVLRALGVGSAEAGIELPETLGPPAQVAEDRFETNQPQPAAG